MLQPSRPNASRPEAIRNTPVPHPPISHHLSASGHQDGCRRPDSPEHAEGDEREGQHRRHDDPRPGLHALGGTLVRRPLDRVEQPIGPSVVLGQHPQPQSEQQQSGPGEHQRGHAAGQEQPPEDLQPDPGHCRRAGSSRPCSQDALTVRPAPRSGPAQLRLREAQLRSFGTGVTRDADFIHVWPVDPRRERRVRGDSGPRRVASRTSPISCSITSSSITSPSRRPAGSETWPRWAPARRIRSSAVRRPVIPGGPGAGGSGRRGPAGRGRPPGSRPRP